MSAVGVDMGSRATSATAKWRLRSCLALMLVFAVGSWAAWSFTVDDSYITFRYSRNLVEGNGPVWNVGEDPVEGFTNFAWMLWHALFMWLGASPALVAKVTSGLLGIAIVAMLLQSRTRGDSAGGLVPAAVFVLFLPTYFHVAGGLETVAFAAVLLRSVQLGLRILDGRTVRDWEPPLLLLLAGMLRPEGAVAALPALLVWFTRNRQRRQAWLWSTALVAVGGSYFAWRWAYFGHPLPNTFYVKFGNVDAGSEWMASTAAAFAPLLLLTLSLLAWKATRWAGILLNTTVAITYVAYAASGPSMDYVHRFAFHAFPVLCLGAGLAVAAVNVRWAAVAAGAVTVLWVTVAGLRPPDLAAIANYGPDLERAHVAIGRGLERADLPTQARTLAVSDAGAIPYFSRWQALDYIGLNDEGIAHGADAAVSIEGAQPTVIVVTSHRPNALPTYVYGVDTEQLTAGYMRLANVQMRDRYFQTVFAVPRWADAIKKPLLRSVESAQRAYDPGRYDVSHDRWISRLTGQL